MNKQFEFLDVIEQYVKMEQYFKQYAPMEYMAYRNTYGLEMSSTASSELEQPMEMERTNERKCTNVR